MLRRETEMETDCSPPIATGSGNQHQFLTRLFQGSRLLPDTSSLPRQRPRVVRKSLLHKLVEGAWKPQTGEERKHWLPRPDSRLPTCYRARKERSLEFKYMWDSEYYLILMVLIRLITEPSLCFVILLDYTAVLEFKSKEKCYEACQEQRKKKPLR